MTKHSEVKLTSVAQQAKPNLLKMKLFAAAFIATLAFACADVSHLGYGYDQPAASAPSNQYIPPAASAPAPVYSAPAPVYQPAAAAPEPVYSAPAPAPVYQPAPSAPVSSYIPPAASAPAPVYSAPAPVYQPAAAAPEPVYSAPAPAPVYAPQPAASEVYEQPAEDGYRYRTVRRRVYKQRRF
ncbi:uncharacterized protein LOC126755825 [Bactrocera neohumeralis]|uniref:pollen-specific leucine-rich repeat extensin-like protein 3 n=1 Tax=Bactrocera tryoni TaxID=59916 RepID=UPI001A967FD1|nr:pollen-specific leucine-rich repeat extensin-like protein 3 [Bactrocera tryoni]XP_050324502.1 uncharacterized protein LOC126755825 [Bactrocera neohumeralis]